MIDVLIAGGGYVGLSLAVSIKKAAPHLAVSLIDGAPDNVWKKDERASAIIAAASQMLDVLGIWSEIEPEAEPIKPHGDHRFEDRRSGAPGVFDLRG